MLLTTISGIVINIQPAFIVFLAMRTPGNVEHPNAKELGLVKTLAWITFFSTCANFVLTFATKEEDHMFLVRRDGTVPFPKALGYATTCAYKGPHGHQLWQWAWTNTYSELLPNDYPYFLVQATALALMYDKIEATCFFAFLSLFFLLVVAGWSVGEAGSVWCWSGILLHVFYLLFPHLKNRFSIPSITTWRGLLDLMIGTEGHSYAKLAGEINLG